MVRLFIAVLFVFKLVSAQAAAAQIDPDAEALIQKARSLARDFPSYEMELRSMIHVAGGASSNTTVPTTVIWAKPDKMRVESKSAVGTVTIVSDGQTTYVYMSSKNQYLKRAAAFSPEIAMQMTGTTPASVRLSGNVKSAKILGEETLIVEGTEILCKAVMVEYEGQSTVNGVNITPGPVVLWIDPKSGVTFKQESSASVESPELPAPVKTSIKMELTKLRTGDSYPESTFQFAPPSGAQEVQQLGMVAFGRTDAVGEPVPALKFQTLDGKPFEVAALKGKTSLLSFRTTWCIPCRGEAAELEKTYQSLRGQNVEIYAVYLDDDAQAVSASAKELGIEFPVLLATTADTGTLSVHAYPTQVVIDPTGNVTRYEVGQRDEAQFRELVGRSISTLPDKPSK